MNELLRYGILFAIGLLIIDTIKSKGGENNDEISADERNVDTGGNSGIDSGKHSTGQSDNWNSVNTEQLI